jgi:peptidyl-tRNA hydrolase
MVPDREIPRDMQKALEQFGCEAQQIIEAFVKTVSSRKRPDRIYHYTNDAGLKGILEHGTLWLTDICRLNDPSELDHGFKIGIKEELEKAVVGCPRECQEFSRILASVTEDHETHGAAQTEEHKIQGSAHYFVCSFSSCGDDLGQWRAYAANGSGFALEFDLAALENGFTHNRSTAPNAEDHAVSFPITYKDAKLADLDRQIIERMLGLISLPRGRNLKDDEINSYTRELALSLMLQAAHAAIFFKHHAYKSEREYRFLETYSVDAPPRVEWNVRRNSLIRHREFNWRSVVPGALTKIIVGPADRKKALQFASDCLLRYPESGNAPIVCSPIPYRN